jgi:hypothetical protein
MNQITKAKAEKLLYSNGLDKSFTVDKIVGASIVVKNNEGLSWIFLTNVESIETLEDQIKNLNGR